MIIAEYEREATASLFGLDFNSNIWYNNSTGNLK